MPTPILAPPGERLQLGRRATLAEARSALAFVIRLPDLPGLGGPDELYLSEQPVPRIALVYHARPDWPAAPETGVALLLTEFRGNVNEGILIKGLGPATRVTPVTVNGRPGYWLDGQPHAFMYFDSSGQVHQDTVRLAGNVLFWEQDGVTFRLEGARDQATALRLAATVR